MLHWHKTDMNRSTRRDFMEKMLGAAAAAAVPACKRNVPPRQTPGDKLRVAIIGLGGFGKKHVAAWMKRADCEIAYLCDVDTAIGARVLDAFVGVQPVPEFVTDMRRIFDDRSVDVVSIATPHHWHALAAIWAMQAGKDVYVEKPVSHNLNEGALMVAAARKYGRICQGGTQRRCHGVVRSVVKHLHEGQLGKVALAHCLTFARRKSIGPRGDHIPPSTVDFDLWCGPAPKHSITRNRFHYDWHWFWEYGNGAIGNNGVHRVDVARWGLGLDGVGMRTLSLGARAGEVDAGETPNTQVTLHVFEKATIVQQVRGLRTSTFRTYRDGVVFFGSEGVIAYSGEGAIRFGLNGKQEHVFTGTNEDPFDNFVRAVRSRQHETLAADIREGHLSSALCHLANISYRLGNPKPESDLARELESETSHDDVKRTLAETKIHLASAGIDIERTPLTMGPWLRVTPGTESVENSEAAPLVTRAYRAPFLVPELAAI
jgi:predicted dehydrogenase